MLIPGLVSVTFRKLPPPEIIELVRQANLRAIEWGGDVHVPPGNLTRAADVRRRTEDAGLTVSAYGSYYRVGQTDPFGPILETAVVLGAPAIRVWAGHVGSAQADAAYRAAIVRDSLRIADLAAEREISISYEFHGGTLTDTNESARELLREVAHANVHTFWQPPNGQPPEVCLEGLQWVLPRLSCVHVFHWWPTPAERRPLAEGEHRWSRYLPVVRSTGRDHVVALEFVRDDSPEQFLADARTLLDWLARS
jgi:3-dehydroshikimate dehydratase